MSSPLVKTEKPPLPTGLGKTFIAATIMLNWFRWTTESHIVFVAPTKPLVSQQVKACFDIAGIPRSATTMLTGRISPGLRAEEWQSKKVFFMTPQTIINDLKTGICDPKRAVVRGMDEMGANPEHRFNFVSNPRSVTTMPTDVSRLDCVRRVAKQESFPVVGEGCRRLRCLLTGSLLHCVQKSGKTGRVPCRGGGRRFGRRKVKDIVLCSG